MLSMNIYVNSRRRGSVRMMVVIVRAVVMVLVIIPTFSATADAEYYCQAGHDT